MLILDYPCYSTSCIECLQTDCLVVSLSPHAWRISCAPCSKEMVCSGISISRLPAWRNGQLCYTENARRRGSVIDDYTEQSW